KLGSAGHAGGADSGADHARLMPDLRDRVAVLHPRGGVVVRLVERGVPHDTEVELKTLSPNERTRSVEQVLDRVGPLRRVDARLPERVAGETALPVGHELRPDGADVEPVRN